MAFRPFNYPLFCIPFSGQKRGRKNGPFYPLFLERKKGLFIFPFLEKKGIIGSHSVPFSGEKRGGKRGFLFSLFWRKRDK